jgi:hypothetical protein
VWSALIERISPIVPAATICLSLAMCGSQRVHIASSTSSPRAAASDTSACASAALSVNGFSTSTCLPASSASAAFA